MAQAIPIALAAYSAYSQHQAGVQNAQVLANEGAAANAQAVQQSNMVERQGRAALGRSSAAIGQAGTGYGGSNAAEMDQAAVSVEMDALNARYKGAFTAYGYNAESGNALKSADANAKNALLKGASQYLFGAGSMG